MTKHREKTGKKEWSGRSHHMTGIEGVFLTANRW